MKTRIVLVGSSGRMGSALAEEVHRNTKFEIVKKISRENSRELKTLKAADFDVAIDFSSPQNHQRLVSAISALRRPLLCGVTGLGSFTPLKRAAKKIPVLYAANTSLGINWLMKCLENLSALQKFDVEICEIHHGKKKDNPSGTALELQKVIEGAIGKPIPRPKGLRGGGVFGDHSVYVFGPDETLILSHRATSRSVFAKGALHGAAWLQRQKPGLYSMQDLIEYRKHDKKHRSRV